MWPSAPSVATRIEREPVRQQPVDRHCPVSCQCRSNNIIIQKFFAFFLLLFLWSQHEFFIIIHEIFVFRLLLALCYQIDLILDSNSLHIQNFS